MPRLNVGRYRALLEERRGLVSGLVVRPGLRPSVRDRALLVEIEAALARIEAGDYGTCSACRGALPERRLEIRPAARRCFSCARGESRRAL